MVTPQQAQIEQLVRDNMGLIRALVAKTMRMFPQLPSSYDRDDLESLGYIGLVQAAQTYDPDRGVAFSTYAYRCIENAISGPLVRAKMRQIDCISLSLLIGEDEDTPLEDQIPSDAVDAADTVISQETEEQLKAAVQSLPSLYSQVILKMYFEAKALSDVAREMRLSAQRVQYLHSRALHMLRRHARALR